MSRFVFAMHLGLLKQHSNFEFQSLVAAASCLPRDISKNSILTVTAVLQAFSAEGISSTSHSL